eukprot:6467441-Amphidinium_carterae.1
MHRMMMKYLETAKIKKHSETIGLHGNVGSRGSINMMVLAYHHRIHTADRDIHLHGGLWRHSREYIKVQQPVLQPKEEIIDDNELIPDYNFVHNNNENAFVSDLTTLWRSV